MFKNNIFEYIVVIKSLIIKLLYTLIMFFFVLQRYEHIDEKHYKIC